MKKKFIGIIWLGILYVVIYLLCVFLQIIYLNMNFWLLVGLNIVSVFTLIFIVDLILKKITKNDNNI